VLLLRKTRRRSHVSNKRSGIKIVQINPSGIKIVQINPSGIKIVQINPSGVRFD